MTRAALAAACAVLLTVSAEAQTMRTWKDIAYARVDGRELRLDLYMPAGVESPPLLVWVHGGAWSEGSKDNVPMIFVKSGLAVASVDFRQSTEARFPAQVHDIKAAIRFLRTHALGYGYRGARLAIGGDSSGGHLAALVGVSNGDAELEGRVGGELAQSSGVQAVVSYYGAADLTTILAQSTPFGLTVRRPALQRLLGALPEQKRQLAELASPALQVKHDAPPLYLLHGDQDPQMPINQSLELQGAYQRQGAEVHLDVVHGAGHGGNAFFAPEHLQPLLDFLTRTLGH